MSSNVIASESLPTRRGRSPIVEGIVWGGATAGVLDIACAIGLTLFYGGSPIRMLQGIASGLIGRSALQGGLSTAALGLGLHFFIATTAATVYVLASRKLPALIERAWLFGPLYGIAVYTVMYYGVMRLAFGRFPTFSWTSLAQGLIVHVLAVGLPIALSARRALRSADSRT